MKHLARTFLSLGAAASLIAGCSTTVPGTAEPDPNALEIKLDTGGVSTKPRTPTAPGSQRKVLAANILSERVLLPSEVEPTYVEGSSRTAVIAKNFIGFDKADTDRISKRGMVYGFVDSREPVKVQTEGLSIYVIRMTDDAAATAAVDDFRTEGNAVEPIPGRSDIATRKTPPDDVFKYTRFTAFAAAGPLLIIAAPYGTDEAKAKGLIAKTVDAQRTKLSGFTSPSSNDLAGLPLDKEGIVSRTVTPDSIEGGTFNNHYGFYERQASLHWDDNTAIARRIFDETGMDLIGIGKNTLYRTRDAAAAKRFVELAGTEWLDKLVSQGPLSIDALPDAKCRTYKSWEGSDTTYAVCYLAVGRYVTAYMDVQSARVRQVTSAAYLVLKNAE